MRDVTVAVEGGHINVWHRAGDHSPTVLMAGLTGNSRWWSRVIEHLPPDMELIAIDVRGRSGSVGAPPPYDMATLASDVALVLDQFDVERATVVGYSMGAWIASLFGELHPTRAHRLVLVDGGFEVPAPPGMKPDEIIEAVVGPSLARLAMHFDTLDDFAVYWKAHPALSSYWEEPMLSALDHELIEDADGFRVRANAEAITTSGREITTSRKLDTAVFRQKTPTHLVVVERGTADQPGGMIPLTTARAASSEPHISYQYVEDVNHYTLVLGKGAPTLATAIVGAG